MCCHAGIQTKVAQTVCPSCQVGREACGTSERARARLAMPRVQRALLRTCFVRRECTQQRASSGGQLVEFEKAGKHLEALLLCCVLAPSRHIERLPKHTERLPKHIELDVC